MSTMPLIERSYYDFSYKIVKHTICHQWVFKKEMEMITTNFNAVSKHLRV